MTVAYFNCTNGISGDMVLGALLDAGASLDAVRDAVGAVVSSGWSLAAERVSRGGVVATRAIVSANDDGASRLAARILEMIESADLTHAVARVALGAVTRLAEAEAAVHGQSAADVHLHEAGGLDAIVDIVGSAAALSSLGIGAVWSSPVGTGSGSAVSRHGPIPVPGPAVVKMLEGCPVRMQPTADELATPTGVALLRGMDAAFEPVEMVVSREGYGAGGRDPADRPNVLQVIVGRPVPVSEPMAVVEANLDDATPEVLAHTVERALAAGAADAWITPVVMKKGRPGATVHVLCAPSLRSEVEDLLLAETGTFGLRRHDVARRVLDRDWVLVEVAGQPVRVKRAFIDGRPVTLAAEYEEARVAAAALGWSLADVMSEAVAQARAVSSSSS